MKGQGNIKYIFIILASVLLIGCGGGVSSSLDENKSNNDMSLITNKSITRLDNGETGFPNDPDVKINNRGQAYALWNDCYTFRKFSYYNGNFWQDPTVISINESYPQSTGDLRCSTADEDALFLNDNGNAAIIRNTLDYKAIRVTYIHNGSILYTTDINGSLNYVQQENISSEKAVINNDGLLYVVYRELVKTESASCRVVKLAIFDNKGLVKIDPLNVSALPCEDFTIYGNLIISLNQSQQTVVYGTQYGYNIYDGTEKLDTYNMPVSLFFPEENFLYMYSDTKGYLQRFQANFERITYISPEKVYDIDLPKDLPKNMANLSSMTVTEKGSIYLSKVISCPNKYTSICDNLTNGTIIVAWKYENKSWGKPHIVFKSDYLPYAAKTKFIYLKEEIALLAYGKKKALYVGCLFDGFSCSEPFEINGPNGVLSPAFDLNKNGELVILGDMGINTNINVSLHQIDLSNDIR